MDRTRAWRASTLFLLFALVAVPLALRALDTRLLVIFAFGATAYALGAGLAAGAIALRIDAAPTNVRDLGRAGGLVFAATVLATVVILLAQWPFEWIPGTTSMILRSLLAPAWVAAVAIASWWTLQTLVLARKDTAQATG